MEFPMNNKNNLESGANAVGHKGIVSAVVTAIYDRFSNKGVIGPLDPNARIDGKTCLITGANSGLGKAIAVQLAQRGGRIIMACRSGIPEAGEEVKKLSGNPNVEMLKVDLADTTSVHKLCDSLRDRKIKIDIAVMNAGLMPLQARRSPQGFELMFAVHFLANRILLERWLSDGVIQPADEDHPAPRVIFVASEAHQSSDPIDFSRFAAFENYGMRDGMKHYGKTKLHLCTFATELSRRLNPENDIRIAVHALCPGPIASNIARESPAYIKPILGPIMKLLFRSPEQAAEPVIYLACAPEMGKRTGAYLHMMREKAMSPLARDPSNGTQLWQHSQQLIDAYR
jgi:NAD(P)-dependent dehydrogenase (short-subunit alcohol dehydrogenase family)